MTDGLCQFRFTRIYPYVPDQAMFRNKSSCFWSNELISIHLRQAEVIHIRDRAHSDDFVSEDRCKCPCFLKMWPCQSHHRAIFGIRGRLAELPRGARDQRQQYRPPQHSRRSTCGQVAVQAEVSRVLPARNRVRWACCRRGIRIPARLGRCSENAWFASARLGAARACAAASSFASRCRTCTGRAGMCPRRRGWRTR